MNVYIKKQRFVWQKVLISSVVLVALVFLLNIFRQPVRNSFFYISSPISNVFLKTGKSTSGFFSSFFSFTALNKENNNLKSENQNLLASIFSLQETVKADQDLKMALQNTQEDKFKLLPTGILALNIGNDTILINKGSSDGIKENMPVISQEKVLFGKVINVYANFSEVMLISSKKSALAVKIQNSDSAKAPIYAAVKGNGNLSVYMDLINSDSEINEGDVLMTSAQEGIFPKNLLVGKIASSTANDAKAFQTAKVEPFFNPKNTDNVFVITNYLKK